MARLFGNSVTNIGRGFSFYKPVSGSVTPTPTPPPPPPISGSIVQLASMTYDATSYGAIKSITDLEPYSASLPTSGFLKYNIRRSSQLGGDKTITVPFYKHVDGKLCQSAFSLTSSELLVGSSSNIFSYGNDDHDTLGMKSDGTGFVSTSNDYSWSMPTISTFRGSSEIATYSSPDAVFGSDMWSFMYGQYGQLVSFPQSGVDIFINTTTMSYKVNGFSSYQLPIGMHELLSSYGSTHPANRLWVVSDGVSSFMTGAYGQTKAFYVEVDLNSGQIYKYEELSIPERYSQNSTEEDVNGEVLFAINAKNSFHRYGSFYASALDSMDVGWRFATSINVGSQWMVGQDTQTGMDIFGSIDSSGYVWFADWGHDNGGLFNKGNDSTLGIQQTNIKLVDPSYQQ